MFTFLKSSIKWGVLFSLLLLFPISSFALTFNLQTILGKEPSAEAQTAFQAAAALWENLFADDITINIDIGMEALGPGILGGTSTVTAGASFSSIKTSLGSDQTSANDGQAVAHLPSGSVLNFITNNYLTGGLVLDMNNSGNNNTLDVSRANLKALGLVGAADAATDATITFSTNFSFDFDPSNGIADGTYDFVGVAAHEIGHALGFISGADIVDLTYGLGPYAPTNLDAYRVFTVMDLYRYSTLSTSYGVPDYSVGASGTRYFSLDAGANSLATFSTGVYNGDGRQASHFQDNLSLGIMDPTAASGELLSISDLDQLIFDVIGYDLINTDVANKVDLGDGIFLTFQGNIMPGSSTKTASSNIASFLADPNVGAIFEAYNISTNTTFSDPVLVEFKLTTSLINQIEALGFTINDFRLFHLSGSVEQLAHTLINRNGTYYIQAATNSFSDFALGMNPEPITFLLLSLSLIGLHWNSRKKSSL